MSQRQSPDFRGEAGFTLIEVLVALGVCGIVVAAITPVITANAIRARQSDGRLALVAAERSLLEILPGRDELRAGAVNGVINGVTWRLMAIPLPLDPDATRRSAWTSYRLVVDLATPNGLTGHVETIRLGKAPAP